jgi:hypothetical protein
MEGALEHNLLGFLKKSENTLSSSVVARLWRGIRLSAVDWFRNVGIVFPDSAEAEKFLTSREFTILYSVTVFCGARDEIVWLYGMLKMLYHVSVAFYL